MGGGVLAQKKENLIRKNVINRYEWDQSRGKSLINDFLQLSQVAEELEKTNIKAYTMFMQLISERLELQNEVRERGKRISDLQNKK